MKWSIMEIEQVTEGIIKQLHIKHADTQRLRQYRYLELTWYHSLIVGKIALQLGRQYQEKTGKEINTRLIKLGSLVSDIGSYQCFDQNLEYAKHAFIGSRILAREGFPQELVEFASTHTGLAAWDVEGLDLDIPTRHYFPRTDEEKLVFYADNFHVKNTWEPRFVSGWKHVITRIQAWDKGSARRRLVLYRDEFGVPDLSVLKEQYKDWHEEMKNYYTSLGLEKLMPDK